MEPTACVAYATMALALNAQGKHPEAIQAAKSALACQAQGAFTSPTFQLEENQAQQMRSFAQGK